MLLYLQTKIQSSWNGVEGLSQYYLNCPSRIANNNSYAILFHTLLPLNQEIHTTHVVQHKYQHPDEDLCKLPSIKSVNSTMCFKDVLQTFILNYYVETLLYINHFLCILLKICLSHVPILQIDWETDKVVITHLIERVADLEIRI